MERIENMLRKTAGLDAAALGEASIARAVRHHMAHLDLLRLDDYAQLLQSSPAVCRELVESVLVSETWFFREPAAFSTAAGLVKRQWLPNHPRRQVRLLSVACATGEEPYSLAMVLLDAGVPTGRFQIDAFDISARALQRARRGLYRKNSFRGNELGFRDRYFRQTIAGFALEPAVIDRVRFEERNLLTGDGQENLRPAYDFIFLRNLLIYFDRPAQSKALARVGQLLQPDGLLFLGAAEQSVALAHGFVSAQIPGAFACRKQGVAPVPGSHSRTLGGTEWPDAVAAPAAHVKAAPVALELPGNADLQQAQRLADTGRFAEAAVICEAHLRQNQPSASAYYLLGLVRDASGDPRASECYRRALYLQPNHYEALLHMALCAQKNGDPAAALNFRRRAQRLKSGA